jgi:hypothetical protein
MVDFFGMDVRCEVDLIEVLFRLDEVLRVLLDEDDRDRPLFWGHDRQWQKKPDGRECYSNALTISNLVGSSAGAVIRRKLLVCIRRFRLRARLGVSVIPFPAPATSHAACGFPALRAPAHFSSRVMKPIVLEKLPALVALGSHQINRAHHTTTADSTASNRSHDAVGLWPSDAELSARPSCE